MSRLFSRGLQDKSGLGLGLSIAREHVEDATAAGHPAIALASIAFALGVLWRVGAGAAVGAAAVFVALRPLFRNRRTGK